MPHSTNHYTTKELRKKLARRSIERRQERIKRVYPAANRVTISFVANKAERDGVEMMCEFETGYSFTLFCKHAWQDFASRAPNKPPKREQIRDMNDRELWYAQFNPNYHVFVDAILDWAKCNPPGSDATTDDIFLVLSYDRPDECTMANRRAIGACMKRLGWPRLMIERDGKRVWAYRRPRDMQFPPEGRS